MRKEQIKKCWKHIRENMGESCIDNLDGLSYGQAEQLVQEGNFACYFYSARRFLMDLYNETEQEAEKYEDAEVWARYKHVLALAISKHFRYSKINV